MRRRHDPSGISPAGLFLQLARLTMTACRQSGIRLLFGFPNQYSLPGFLEKLGWRKETGWIVSGFRLPICELPYFIRRLPLTGRYYDRYANYV